MKLENSPDLESIEIQNDGTIVIQTKKALKHYIAGKVILNIFRDCDRKDNPAINGIKLSKSGSTYDTRTVTFTPENNYETVVALRIIAEIGEISEECCKDLINELIEREALKNKTTPHVKSATGDEPNKSPKKNSDYYQSIKIAEDGTVVLQAKNDLKSFLEAEKVLMDLQTIDYQARGRKHIKFYSAKADYDTHSIMFKGLDKRETRAALRKLIELGVITKKLCQTLIEAVRNGQTIEKEITSNEIERVKEKQPPKDTQTSITTQPVGKNPAFFHHKKTVSEPQLPVETGSCSPPLPQHTGAHQTVLVK